MLLYNSAVSGNCYKVRLLLAQLGLEYETVELSVVDRSNRAEVLGDLNPELRVPTLVLIGEHDALQREPAELLGKRIPGARLVVVPGGGHLLNLTSPKEFEAAVSAFLK